MKRSLKQNIMILLFAGWFLPVLLLTLVMMTVVGKRANEQIEHTVATSMEKAVEIFDLELDACETASKNASYYSDIREAYLAYQAGDSQNSFNNSVNTFLKNEYKYNSLTKSAVLVLVNDPSQINYAFNNSTGASYQNIENFKALVRNTVLAESSSLGTKTTLMEIGGRLYMVRNLMLSNFEPYAVLTLEVNGQSLLSGMESVWGAEDTAVFLDGEPALGQADILSDREILSLETALKSTGSCFYHKGDRAFIAFRRQYYGKNIDLVVTLDTDTVFSQIHTTWITFLFLVLLLIPLTVIIFRFFRRNVTKPMEVLTSAYGEVGNKNYGYQITDLADNREFYYMQESFNQMSFQIADQFNRIYREEIALRDAHIMALESQINPHFLNNTFEIINWEARLNGNIKVSKMIEALSTMLEATMNRRGDHFHTLAEEISYVDAYAYIISERLGDRFSFIKKLDESLLSIKVPRLIIQPIVENAVEHGLSRTEHGNITLSLFREENFICIEVLNDGVLSEEDKKKIDHILKETIDPDRERSLSLGIRNVNNRIKLIYGDPCGLFIEGRDGALTASTIKILAAPVVEQ